jgi:hypothetical protein
LAADDTASDVFSSRVLGTVRFSCTRLPYRRPQWSTAEWTTVVCRKGLARKARLSQIVSPKSPGSSQNR